MSDLRWGPVGQVPEPDENGRYYVFQRDEMMTIAEIIAWQRRLEKMDEHASYMRAWRRKRGAQAKLAKAISADIEIVEGRIERSRAADAISFGIKHRAAAKEGK